MPITELREKDGSDRAEKKQKGPILQCNCEQHSLCPCSVNHALLFLPDNFSIKRLFLFWRFSFVNFSCYIDTHTYIYTHINIHMYIILIYT